MNTTKVQEKIQKIEAELELLRNQVAREPDFAVDKRIWEKLEPDVKKIRKRLFKEIYSET